MIIVLMIDKDCHFNSSDHNANECDGSCQNHDCNYVFSRSNCGVLHPWPLLTLPLASYSP